MKKSILFLSLFLCLGTSINLQAQLQYSIRNVGTGNYLNYLVEESLLSCEQELILEYPSAIWEVEFVGGSTHTFRLKNTGTSGYLYIEDGTNPQCGITEKTEKAAWFVFQQIPEVSGALRLRSAAYLDLYLKCKEDGTIETTKLNQQEQACMWLIEEM